MSFGWMDGPIMAALDTAPLGVDETNNRERCMQTRFFAAVALGCQQIERLD